ncbi:ras-like GTP-binding protein Rho1 [Procambarus clarkii]|uniref:ras-like GTP-binding protein Rho1 n=1 Tax=Procambarus clarkii TaxID=6728 RepID=UPI001E674C6B|nr:ras-like GTP-binding protein Rho1 [Procambarus clarkii]
MVFIRIKLFAVGDAGSGITSLLVVFLTNVLPEDHVPTIFEKCIHDMETDGKQVQLRLWYRPCPDHYDSLRIHSYSGTDVFLICFSIASPDSLQSILDKWSSEVQHYCPKVPIIVVGNKKDLRDDAATIEELRKVDQEPVKPEDGQNMAEKINAYAYVECSAKTTEGVQEVFETAVKAALDHGAKKSRCTLL